MTSLFSRLQKLNKEATPRKWVPRFSPATGSIPAGWQLWSERIETLADFGDDEGARIDAELTAECRNSLPAVLNLIEAAQRAITVAEDVRIPAVNACGRVAVILSEAVAVFVTPEGDRSTMSGQEDERRSP